MKSYIDNRNKMNFSLVGDSNFRDLFALHRGGIDEAAGSTVRFDLATSVASVRTVLDGPRAGQCVTFLACPTNEIALKSKNNTKSREGIIENVLNDFLDAINQQGLKDETSFFIICQPFLRLDPPWLKAKMEFYKTYLKTIHANLSPPNVFIGGVIEVLTDDLKADRIHLSEQGMEKLRSVIVTDIGIAVRDCPILAAGGVILNDEVDMDEAPLSQLIRSAKKTPLRKKRVIEESSEDDGKTSKRKKTKEGKMDGWMSRMELMMKDLHDDRANNKIRFDKLDDKLEETIIVQENLKEQVEAIKQSDHSFSATIMEDLDAVENANLRDTVIVKKLAADKTIPTDRKELSSMILEAGKELLTEVMGSDKGMKYISPLYFRNDKRTPKEGDRNEFPPFKIIFKHLPDAIEFKEKVITASKIPTHRLYKCYVANQQNISTRVRLMLLWAIVDILKKEKKESWVNQSSPKPTLQVKMNGTLVKQYSYIDAISAYGERIDKKVIDEATKLASRFFYGQVEKIFIILKD